jgi:molecular chaperone GrpE
MVKANGKETDPNLDLEHELPPGEEAATDTTEARSAEQVESESELEKLKAQNRELLDRMARMQAEFENARRRAAREQQEYKDYALTDAVRNLLPVLDSFDRALASNATGDNFRAGMELIDRQFHDALTKLGVQEIAAEGKPFDPTQHEAVEMVDTDEVPDNHVLQELQRGYKLKERLLRPAMVRVGRNPGK